LKVGDKVVFVPYSEKDAPCCRGDRRRSDNEVEGTIVGYNRGHRFYRVEYEVGGVKHHECFKFIPRNNAKVKPCKQNRWGEIDK